MVDFSLLVPGIRTHHWNVVYESMARACPRHSFEIVFAGPFDPPGELADKKNVQFIKTYVRPSSACQMAALACTGRLLMNGPDDAIYAHDTISLCIEQYDRVGKDKDVINARFTEAKGFAGHSQPDDFWRAHFHWNLKLSGIPTHYQIAMGPILSRNYFMELGGYDCEYEYMNFNLHDLMFRIQYDGGRIHHSAHNVIICNTLTGTEGDHAPIHHAHDADMQVMAAKYGRPDALSPSMIRIDVENWKRYPQPWERRFHEPLPTTYLELMAQSGVTCPVYP